MKKEYVFGISGFVVGALIVLISANIAVNANNASMMKMMGMQAVKTQNVTSSNNNAHVMPDGSTMQNMDDSMSMDEMTDELKGKTGDEFDKAFIEMMIPHHQGAIDMAELALKNAGHQEIKDMANDIINAQNSEINVMKDWQESWGY